ncbi:MAG: glutamyl-tRNA reductase [Flavobacteriales bacterium]|nr:glutamyl-tRNA reductase [Flavobacteriales bacterium]
MEQLQVIAITHRNTPLELVGKLHLEETRKESVLGKIKSALNLHEIAYVSTCNRVEFIVHAPAYFCQGQRAALLSFFGLDQEETNQLQDQLEHYQGEEAVLHLIKVASSLESMVLGEREIITQVRKAFDEALAFGNSGDFLKILSKKVIETAKRVFTETKISTKPVSVVSLAWQEFKQRSVPQDRAVLLIGAGQTIGNLARFLYKGGYKNVVIANRTLSKAQELCSGRTGWQAISLEDLRNGKQRFSAIFTCTGSEAPLIEPALFEQLAAGHFELLTDIALPADTDQSLIDTLGSKFIGMQELKAQADVNIAQRGQELEACLEIIQDGLHQVNQEIQQRRLEIAMREIPQTIKDIRSTAIGEVFAKDLENLDSNSKEVLEKILLYMEKKYISLPMKMARAVILENVTKN